MQLNMWLWRKLLHFVVRPHAGGDYQEIPLTDSIGLIQKNCAHKHQTLTEVGQVGEYLR